MQAKIGCGSGSSRTHRYQAISAASAVWRIADVRALRRRRAVVRCAKAVIRVNEGSTSASAKWHAALSADLRRALPRDRSALPAGPQPGLPARAVHGRPTTARGSAGLDVVGGAVVSGSFQAYDQTYLVDALRAARAGVRRRGQRPVGHHRRRGAGAGRGGRARVPGQPVPRRRRRAGRARAAPVRARGLASGGLSRRPRPARAGAEAGRRAAAGDRPSRHVAGRAAGAAGAS